MRIKNVKIYGAGSIGNHLANACVTLGANVDLLDKDDNALIRTRNQIYPARYKKWNSKINLYNTKNFTNKNKYDLVVVGTPPESHLRIAIDELKKFKPKALMIEKPLTVLNCKKISEFIKELKLTKTKVFMGYDHAISKVVSKIRLLLDKKILGEIKSIDVDFREYWGGIFKAHPWLDGPKDSYLGYIKKGGAALFEHSHGVNLWLTILKFIDSNDTINSIKSNIIYKKSKSLYYDEVFKRNLLFNF